MHVVVDSRKRGYFSGSEIECQRFIVDTTLVVTKIGIVSWPDGISYKVETNLGYLQLEQNDDGKRPMFYTCDYGVIGGERIRDVIVETLAWDMSYNQYLCECELQGLDSNDPFCQEVA